MRLSKARESDGLQRHETCRPCCPPNPSAYRGRGRAAGNRLRWQSVLLNRLENSHFSRLKYSHGEAGWYGAAASRPLPSKGRLIRCTVPGSTPKRFAILRTPSVRPGAFRAARIRASTAGAIRGRPSRLPSALALRDEQPYFEETPDLNLPKEMLDLATHIVQTKSGHFDPAQFEDRYENALIDLLKKKEAGETIEPAKEGPAPQVVNLMEALRAKRSVTRLQPYTSRQSAQCPLTRRGNLPAPRLLYHSTTVPSVPAWAATCPSMVRRLRKRPPRVVL